MPEQLTAYAEVPTDAAARYVKQLGSHLGRKLEVLAEPEGDRLVFDGGSCLATATATSVQLRATADSAEILERVQHVVGSHLERFGQRNELLVVWTSGAQQ